MKFDHYVYVYKDTNGTIVYVGEGRLDRYKNKSSRTSDFIEFVKNNEYSVEIINKNLSKIQAQELELNMINEYQPILNKKKTGFIKELKYEELCQWFYVDLNSPTHVRWKQNVYSGEYWNVLSAVKDTPAGNFDSNGLPRLSFKGRTYRTSRVLWCLYHKQDVPAEMVITYADGDSTNLSIENLIAVNKRDAVANYSDRKPAGNSGIIGVSIKTSVRGIRSFYGTVRYDGKLYEKGFSERKYGHDKAIELALEWRKEKIKELEKQDKE